MIKVIAFDLGGVLFTEGKSVAVKVLKEKYGYDEKVCMDVFMSDLLFDLRIEGVSPEDCWAQIGATLPEGYDIQIIRKEYYDGYVLDKDIFDLVKYYSGKIKILIYSGNIRERVVYLESKHNFRKYFDDEVYTYDCKVQKKTPEFANFLIEKSEFKPEEIILIDDSEKASQSAKDLGVNIILYKTGKIEELKGELKKFEFISK